MVTMLIAVLSLRVARRRQAGAVQRQLYRLAALARSAAIVAGLGIILALLPTQWLPWFLLVAASAAVAIGWSLRPLVADVLAGLYLGVSGRHSPGATVRMPDGRGVLHRPGPLYSIVRTESGAMEIVPNRKLAIDATQSTRTERHPVEIAFELPHEVDAAEALAAVHWACDLLPWTASDPPRVRPPVPGSGHIWTVELMVLGHAPPTEKVRLLIPRLVHDVLHSRTPQLTEVPPGD